MSAIPAPKDPKPTPGPEADSHPKVAPHPRRPDQHLPEGAVSPARQLQSELVERLQRPRTVSLRALLATLLVLSLAMSVAALSLIASA